MSEENSSGKATSRSGRPVGRHSSKNALLNKIKEARSSGTKLKAQQKDEEMVYEYVDEKKYIDIVQKRLEDDWIEDDGLHEDYLDDGRDLFDDIEAEMEKKSRKAKSTTSGIVKSAKPSRNRNIGRGESCRTEDMSGDDDGELSHKVAKKSHDIRDMLYAAPMVKKTQEKFATLGKDDDLDFLLADIHTSTTNTPKNRPSRTEKISASFDRAARTKIHGIRRQKSSKTAASDFGIEPPPATHIPEDAISKEMNPFAVPKSDEKGTAMSKTPITSVSKVVNTDCQDANRLQRIDLNASYLAPDNVMDISDIHFDDDEEGQDVPTDSSGSVWTTSVGEMDSALGSGVSQSDEYVNNSDGMFRFYWIDAYEDVKTQPGVLYIFGKQYNESSQSFHSCCLRVKGLQRKMFFLPAIRLDGTNYSIKEVYSELANMFEKMKIPKFKCKPVVKQYCFEPFDVPDRAEYLEVLYAATSPALPADFKGKSFSHVFGTATSLLENFVLDHQLKGPCWLDVKNAKLVQPQFSWCKVDWEIENESWLTKVVENCPPIPPLTAMAISLKISSSSKDGQNMIVAVGCLVDRKFQIDAPAPQVLYQEQFGVITNPRDAVLPFDFHDILQQGKWGPKYKSVEDDACGERSLLSRLLNFWQRVDPDIVIGHDLCAFELDILVQRLYVHRQGLWHKIGRLRRSGVMPKITGSARTAWLEKSAFVGRLICDSRVSAKELIRARAFDLSELVRVLIGNKKDAGSLLQGLALLSTPGDGGNATDLRHLYDNSLSLRKLIDFTFVSAYASLRLIHEMQVMPLALQITTICGNFLNRTLIGGRAERNEYLLLHAFTEKNYIPPDKGFKKHSHSEDHNAVTLGRRKPAYTGGLVLEPKKGFYDKFILLLDFNSLYPSIMQEYNICFTTISRQEMAAKKRDESAVSEEKDENTFLPTLPHSNVAQGVLPTEIRKLVESRRAVKALLSKNASATVTQKSQWDIRQKALKITANSMYGCLGFGFSRFHAQHLAALITAKGREILMKTKDLVEGMGFEVIYGDTDSIMVNVNSTDYDQIFKIGGKIKAEVNKLYKMLELEVDGVFKAMLLLKKKQYAALTIVGKNPDGSLITKQELKGVDIVRRDWCRLAVEVGENIVTQILNVDEESQSLGLVDNIFEQLRQTAARIQEGKIPIEKYVITKALAKNPEDYHDPKGQPHVLVALRLNSSSGGDKSGNTGGKRLKAGDTVEYIICDDASNTPATQRAYALQEVKARASSDKPLPVDLHYYLSHQLHPVISRLCSVIDGIDGANLADALGLDPTSYATADRAHREATGEASDDEGQRDNIGRHRYDACDPLQLICPHCSQPLPEIRKPFTAVDKENEIALNHWKCPACDKIVLSQEESIAKIFNQILILIRQFQRKYSSGLLQCDNGAVACGYQVRQIPCMSTTSIAQQLACPHCCQGQLRPAYSAGKLYRQLDFIRFLFDVGEPEKGDGSVAKLQETFVDLVNGFLKKSDYSVVSCDILFADLMKFAAVNV